MVKLSQTALQNAARNSSCGKRLPLPGRSVSHDRVLQDGYFLVAQTFELMKPRKDPTRRLKRCIVCDEAEAVHPRKYKRKVSYLTSTLKMLFPLQIFIIVAHSLTFVCSQSTVPFLNNSAIALPLSSGGFTATASDANNDWLNTGFACENGGTGSLATRPKLTECTNALFIMPPDDVVRTFTGGGSAFDKYQLPKSFQFGACKITINMVQGVTSEVTSWHHIGLDATRLVLACDGSKEARFMWRTGGKVKTGGSRGILISVYNFLRPPPQVDEDNRGMMNESSVI